MGERIGKRCRSVCVCVFVRLLRFDLKAKNCLMFVNTQIGKRCRSCAFVCYSGFACGGAESLQACGEALASGVALVCLCVLGACIMGGNPSGMWGGRIGKRCRSCVFVFSWVLRLGPEIYQACGGKIGKQFRPCVFACIWARKWLFRFSFWNLRLICK